MTDVPARRSVWKFQVQVIRALVLREMMARFGQTRMSYLWALIQPTLVILALLAIFSVKGRMAPPNIPLTVFLLSGYPLWFTFQAMWGAISSTERGAQGLLMFPQITILDVMVSRFLLEFATQTTYYVLVVAGFLMFGAVEFPTDPMGVMMGFWANVWLGAMVGLFVAAVKRIMPMAEDWLAPIRRFGLFFSGVIFTAASLPSFALGYFAWNPVFRAIEMSRQSWHPTYQSPIYDPMYVLLCCVGVTAVAIILERGTRRYAGT